MMKNNGFILFNKIFLLIILTINCLPLVARADIPAACWGNKAGGVPIAIGCCTKVVTDCSKLVDNPLSPKTKAGYEFDDSCRNRAGWGTFPNAVCCDGPIRGGNCVGDSGIIAPTVEITTPVTAATTRQLPRLSSLIKLGRNQFIGNIIKSLLGFAGTLTVIMMVYGGLLWMTAAGNDKAVTQAKKIIFWTAVGLVLIFSSYAILKFLFDSLMPAA